MVEQIDRSLQEIEIIVVRVRYILVLFALSCELLNKNQQLDLDIMISWCLINAIKARKDS